MSSETPARRPCRDGSHWEFDRTSYEGYSGVITIHYVRVLSTDTNDSVLEKAKYTYEWSPPAFHQRSDAECLELARKSIEDKIYDLTAATDANLMMQARADMLFDYMTKENK